MAAYEAKSQSKRKKFAKGGDVSVKEQSRPMPESVNKDAQNVAKAEAKPSPMPKIAVKKESKLAGQPMGFSVKSRQELDAEKHMETMPPKKYEGMSEDKGPAEEDFMADQNQMLAEGGEIANMKENYSDMDLDEMEHKHASLAEAIMHKRRMMAEGGFIDLTKNQKPTVSNLEDLNEEAVSHDMEVMPDQPKDSNEHGDDIESDVRDMVSKIRSKMKKGM